MDIDKAFPSKYIRPTDLNGRDYTLTIDRVEMGKIGTDMKAILYFRGTEKALALNVTNKNAIKAAYGKETNAWPGKKITLYPTTTEYHGEIKDCVRVRIARDQETLPTDKAPVGAEGGDEGDWGDSGGDDDIKF